MILEEEHRLLLAPITDIQYLLHLSVYWIYKQAAYPRNFFYWVRSNRADVSPDSKRLPSSMDTYNTEVVTSALQASGILNSFGETQRKRDFTIVFCEIVVSLWLSQPICLGTKWLSHGKYSNYFYAFSYLTTRIKVIISCSSFSPITRSIN